ncbi:MAG TPA: DUF6325 family protein [Intrasporangium sp.]|uniref:DUF6325 family protein n=1 Tax=Intrasporangium sp. TaxID=1925024 RepID=UPI002B4877FE|nr:DUF6325 family protein [Intrasporangium sp.]HKX68644.1 DUF6325 family protein [Intrasporangium sp.]
MGPVHYVVVAFDHPDFHGRLAAELAALVDSGTVRLLDLVFVDKDVDGQVTTLEVDGLPDDWAVYGSVEGAYGGLVSEEDLAEVGDRLPPGSAAALLLWENTWAQRFVSALAETGGVVVDQGVVPATTAEPALSALDQPG